MTGKSRQKTETEAENKQKEFKLEWHSGSSGHTVAKVDMKLLFGRLTGEFFLASPRQIRI